MYDSLSRRDFIKAALVAGTAAPLVTSVAARPAFAKPAKSPNEKLNLGVIGVYARGGANLEGVSSENIVALCDIDAGRLAEQAAKFPQAKTYDDYRRVLDHQELDGVVVSTPDHMHAIPVAAALRRGLDVYCEKPLTHSVHEARVIRQLTAQHKAVTQMGTQIHAGDNYRRVVEMVQAGVIGPVRRVHVWLGGSIKEGQRVKSGQVPAGINYDLWLGPAPFRPFHVSHFHFNWRYWWDFGNGLLGDFGCHYMDLPFWALGLGAPQTVVAKGEKAHGGDNEVPALMQVDYAFPARGEQPSVHLTWYHGAWRPAGAEAYQKGSAVLFEGDRGRILADYGTRKVFMKEGQTEEPVKPSIPNSIGHHREWIEAVKSRGPTTCNFEYGGNLTEAVLLGNVSYRTGGEKLEWDAASLKAQNCPSADQFIRREYRPGWTL